MGRKNIAPQQENNNESLRVSASDVPELVVLVLTFESRALLLLLLVEAVVGANVTQSRTYFSDVFRMLDGTQVWRLGGVAFFSL
jgi:hypothetical protein